MHSRSSIYRNFIVRSVASVAGDIAAGVAVAAVCTWIIETATLGLFLSFLIWLLGILISLALSQHVVHPTIKLALSDDKLDRSISAVSDLCESASAWMRELNVAEIASLLHRLWPGLNPFGRASTG